MRHKFVLDLNGFHRFREEVLGHEGLVESSCYLSAVLAALCYLYLLSSIDLQDASKRRIFLGHRTADWVVEGFFEKPVNKLLASFLPGRRCFLARLLLSLDKWFGKQCLVGKVTSDVVVYGVKVI